jgi:prepilin-type N-terminal cleavage/methylation domain-containing protein
MRRGFTLAELLLVMVVLGVIIGMSLGGMDRMDPGARGLQKTVGTFILSSRDRARATGLPVVISLDPATEETPARMKRMVFRPVVEATFETQSADLENIQVVDPGLIRGRGRVGAGLDLSQGGGAHVHGRGGVIATQNGLRLVFDMKPQKGASGALLEWKELAHIQLRADGSLQSYLMAGDGVRFTRQSLHTQAGSVIGGEWNRIILSASVGGGNPPEGIHQLQVNGKVVAEGVLHGQLAEVNQVPFLGDPDGRYRGLIDEFSIWTRTAEYGPSLVSSAEVLFPVAEIHFDRFGRLDASLHPEGVPVIISDEGEPQSHFLIGRFTEERVGDF